MLNLLYFQHVNDNSDQHIKASINDFKMAIDTMSVDSLIKITENYKSILNQLYKVDAGLLSEIIADTEQTIKKRDLTT